MPIITNKFNTGYTIDLLRKNFLDIDNDKPNNNTQKELKRFFLQGDNKIETDINLFSQMNSSIRVIKTIMVEMFKLMDDIDEQPIQNAGGNKYKKQYNKTKNNKYKSKGTKKHENIVYNRHIRVYLQNNNKHIRIYTCLFQDMPNIIHLYYLALHYQSVDYLFFDYNYESL